MGDELEIVDLGDNFTPVYEISNHRWSPRHGQTFKVEYVFMYWESAQTIIYFLGADNVNFQKILKFWGL